MELDLSGWVGRWGACREMVGKKTHFFFFKEGPVHLVNLWITHEKPLHSSLHDNSDS